VTGGKLASNVIGSYNINTSGTITSSNTNGITANKITITSIATTGAGCVGKGTITGGDPNTIIINPNITSNNAIILVTPTTNYASTYEALAVTSVNGPLNRFTVGFVRSGAVAPTNINFNYLIFSNE
jgi:hypothetical protein